MFWLLKHVFKDVMKLYSNFLHWNFSKISIAVFGFIIALSVMIPFLLITFIILFIFNVDWYAYTGHLINNTLTNDMVLHKDFFLWAILWIFNAVIFFFGWSYARIMYFDLNLKYIDHKKTKYNKMRFFHFPIIWNYYKMSWIIATYLLIPIVIGLVVFSIFIASFWGINQAWVEFTNGSQIAAIGSLLIALITWLSFIYLSFRFYFSYIIFVENHDSEKLDFSVKKCIKQSWNLTKGWKSVMKLLGVLFVTVIVLLPANLIEESLNKTYTDINNYQLFISVWESDKLKLQESDPYYYGQISLKYQQISAEDLEKNIQIYYYLIIFFNILLFLFIAGLMEMVMVSFYKRVLTHK